MTSVSKSLALWFVCVALFLFGGDFSLHWLATHVKPEAAGKGGRGLRGAGLVRDAPEERFLSCDVTKVTLLPCERRTRFLGGTVSQRERDRVFSLSVVTPKWQI